MKLVSGRNMKVIGRKALQKLVWVFVSYSLLFNSSLLINGLAETASNQIETANAIANQMLETIYEARHKTLFDLIENFDESKFEAMRRQKLAESQRLIENLPEKSEKRAQISQKLEIIKESTVAEYKKFLTDQIRGEKRAETIAIMIVDDKVDIAGNLKTRMLPMALDNPELYEILLSFKKTGKGIGFKFYKYKDFGIQDFDALAIKQTITKFNSDLQDITTSQFLNVGIVKTIDLSDISNKFNEEIDKLKHNLNTDMRSAYSGDDEVQKIERQHKEKLDEFMKNYKKQLEEQGADKEQLRERSQMQIQKLQRNKESQIQKAMNPSPETVERKIQKANLKYETDLSDFNDWFERVNSAKYHAEIVLAVNNADKLQGVLGVSKAVCDKCQDFLSDKEINFDKTKGRDKSQKINHEIPQAVKRTSLDTMVELYRHRLQVTDSASPFTPEFEFQSCIKKNRRKRSTQSKCVFILADSEKNGFDDIKREKMNILEVDSDAFLDEYEKSPPDERNKMSELVESSNAKLIGEAESVAKVSKIVQHQKLSKHDKRISSAKGSLLDIDSDFDLSNSNIRLSPKKTIAKLGKRLEKAGERGQKISAPIGKFLLAKGIVQAISNDDINSLYMMTGRVGGEMALELFGKGLIFNKVSTKALTKLGVKASAKGISKTFDYLAKAANPIGAVFDVGYSGYQLHCAIQSYKNPNANKFEQNDAMADIVEESLDIAITALTTVSMFVFPPFAPLIAAIGFFGSLFISATASVYKHQNFVDSINSKLPLLDYEKREQLLRRAGEQDVSQYIKNLLIIKNANNFAVNQSVQLLEKQVDIIGVVFPSRNIEPKNQGNDEILIYKDANSKIDFQRKQFVYTDRSTPNHPYNQKYNTICNPSSAVFKGDKNSEKQKSSQFLCENSIGIQRKDRKGKFMLFDLEQGYDQVYLDENDKTNITFIVNDGLKQLFGGGGSDMFLINGPCAKLSGILNGGGGQNVLVIGEGCQPLETIKIDLLNLKMAVNHEDVDVKSIQVVKGRTNVHEQLTVGCDTILVALDGGSPTVPDIIEFPKQPKQDCFDSSKLQIISTGHTIINALTQWNSFTTQLKRNKDGYLNFTTNYRCGNNKIFILEFYPQELKSFYTQIINQNYKIEFEFGVNSPMIFNIYPDIRTRNVEIHLSCQEIFFSKKQSQSTTRMFIEASNGAVLLLHEVNCKSSEFLEGAPGAPNYFNIGSHSHCDMKGGNGNYDNTFIIKAPFTGSIIARGMGLSSLLLDNSLIGKVRVDLRNERVVFHNSSAKVHGTIHRIKGRDKISDEIFLGCDTQTVDSGGGSGSLDEDKVYISSSFPCKPNISVFVHPHTVINNHMQEGYFKYIVMKNFNFIINTFNSDAFHEYRFQFGLQHLSSVYFSAKESQLSILLKISSKALLFRLKRLNLSSGSHLFDNVELKFEDNFSTVSIHVFETGEILASIRILTSMSFVEGVNGAYNSIEIDVGNSNSIDILQGTELDDSFKLTSAESINEINGRYGEKNMLEIANTFSIQNDLIVDVRSKNGIIYKKIETEIIYAVQIRIDSLIYLFEKNNVMGNSWNNTIVRNILNIQLFKGREQFHDTIYIGCDTVFVSGFKEIIITQLFCPNPRKIHFEIGEVSTVYFQTQSKSQFEIFLKGEFHYNFKSLRSFDFNADLKMYFFSTQHIYHLAFKLKELESIDYDWNNAALIYTINGQDYNHSLDTFTHQYDEFYAQPKFQTDDGFQIKVSKRGEVLITSGSHSWSSFDDDDMAITYSVLAEHLGVSFLIEGQDNFLYAGHDRTRNVLTNREGKRSILCGGGGNGSMYQILELSQDVKIYPAPSFWSQECLQTLDLSNVIYLIRESTVENRKWVPSVDENEQGDILILMTGFTDRFPGKVILVQGKRYYEQIHVQLDAVVMQITPGILASERRTKLTIGGIGVRWWLKPIPLVLSGAETMILSMEDLELGQEISIQVSDNVARLQPFRNGDAMYFSNLKNVTDISLLSTLTIVDAYELQSNENQKISESIVMVSDIFSENEKNDKEETLFDLIEGAMQDENKDWEYALEEVEEELIGKLPHVPKLFLVPDNKKTDKKYGAFLWWILIFLTTMIVIILSLLVWKYNCKWKYNLRVMERGSIQPKSEDKEMQTLMYILPKHDG